MRHARPVLAAFALASVVLAGVAVASPSSAPAGSSGSEATSTRATPTRFGVGVQATLDAKTMNGWVGKTGGGLDYTYRYLGGGINTGAGRNWTDTEQGGTYPITFAKAAASKGTVPVFSYYQLLAVQGRCDDSCGEAKTDLTNLNDPAVMKLYLQDFRTLMQRLGTGTYDGVAGYGKDAVVHVEPDLSGYAENAVLSPSSKCFGFCTGTGNDPSLLKAAVASSGLPEVAGLPDTYRGFNQALLTLRDTYAPTVRLGLHVSNWATGFDLNSSTDATLDAAALGNRAGTFAAASGAQAIDGKTSTYDLLFNDVSNKDAAYYTYVMRKPRFWDQDNAVFPNFQRWETYVKAATGAAGKKALVWQVPMGNQLYRSMNNTPGHYQDNRVEYFFGHVTELRDAGIVGMLFGNTIDPATSYFDAEGDGVTNPAAICSSDGWSSGKQVCSSVETPAADDDGGYLRVSVQDYAKHRVPLA